jgi:phosphotransferase system  glucose/maltose/N-acetylglucosamine-specific IIC component
MSARSSYKQNKLLIDIMRFISQQNNISHLNRLNFFIGLILIIEYSIIFLYVFFPRKITTKKSANNDAIDEKKDI